MFALADLSFGRETMYAALLAKADFSWTQYSPNVCPAAVEELTLLQTKIIENPLTPFTTHTGIVATMDRANVDTDQIIPKQFLKAD